MSFGLVLEHPVALVLFLLANQGVVTESSIHESIGVSPGLILLGTVQLGFTNFSLLEVSLEDNVGVLGRQLVQILGELLVVLTESLLGNDLVELIVLRLEGSSLSSEHECHLLLGD